MKGESDLTEQIVRLLQEIIIYGTRVIYEKQRESAQRWGVTYPYSGPVLVFERIGDTITVTAAANTRIQQNPGDWKVPKLGEISQCLERFSRWQGRLGHDLEEDLYLIGEHLRPLALQTLKQVSTSYGFWPRNEASSPIRISFARTTNLFSDKAKDEDKISLREGLEAPELRALAEEFNLLYARMVRIANLQRSSRMILSPALTHVAGAQRASGTGSDPGIATMAENVALQNDKVEETGKAGELGQAASRRAAVDAYIDEVLKKTGKRITRTDIWKRVGYKHRTEFERWQRADPRTNKSADERFTRLLREKPHLK